MPSEGTSLRELEEAAKRRFVRWDSKLWVRLLEGPARRLAESLAQGEGDSQANDALIESYLKLAVEGIGLGYITPEESGAETVASRLFLKLVPETLGSLPPRQRAVALASSWNLAENLESQPIWVRRVFLRALRGTPHLDHLEELVADVSQRLETPPEKSLKDAFEGRWVSLADEDSRFLPGGVHFAAPTVVCVHERRREDASSIGVWLEGAQPLVLGSLGCREKPAKDPGLRIELLEELSKRDARTADWHAMAANQWRAAVTLETSQFLVALYPV
jgi:hypothetical protein